MARNVVVGTAGHIDHGKTALVRALTGVDTDRLPEEKRRGVTIEPGFAALALGEWELALVDVPGHERFIRNMLAGATGLDLAMLVVAADDSVMPQTREHLEILRFLDLKAGVIVLTKCDLADPGWLALVEDDIRGLVRGTFLEGADIVRTSAATGAGISALKTALASACARLPARLDLGVFRMAIDRSFSMPGQGTVVTGTVSSGEVRPGDEVDWLPVGKALRVRGIERHGRSVESAGRGTRAALNLAGVHHTEITRGHELGTPGAFAVERVLTVELSRAGMASGPLRRRGRYKLHLGTAEVSALLEPLGSTASDDVLDASAPRLVQLLLAEPVASFHGEPFVLRAESPAETVGGGRIVHASSRRCRGRDHATLERLERLRSGAAGERLEAVLALAGLATPTDALLATRSGIPLAEIPHALGALESSGRLVALALGPRRSIRLPAGLVLDLEDRVRRALDRLHTASPRAMAFPRASVAPALPDLPPELVAGLLERLGANGSALLTDRTVALAGRGPALTQAERKLLEVLAEKIEAGGVSPPETSELAAAAGTLAPAVPQLLALLRDQGRVAEINSQLYLAADVEAEIRSRVRAKLADGSSLTMAELRDLLGTTRKYAVPLGEYLDRAGVTRREGDTRRLGPGVK